MRAVATFIALCAVVVLTEGAYKYRDRSPEFRKAQKTILEVFKNLKQVDKNSVYYKDAKHFIFEDELDLSSQPEVVAKFLRLHKSNPVSRDSIFSLYKEHHLDYAISLFQVFMHAADWMTLFGSMVWAKYNVNSEVFVYALTVALRLRSDYADIELPAAYEMFPNYFIRHTPLSIARHIYLQGTNFTPAVIVVDDPSLFCSLQENAFEPRLAYFTEDPGLNAYYYYLNTNYPYWLSRGDFKLEKADNTHWPRSFDSPSWLKASDVKIQRDRNNQLMLFEMQQIMARYYLERLSNNLDDTPPLSYADAIPIGYSSHLKHVDGKFIAKRLDGEKLYYSGNSQDVQKLLAAEFRISDAIASGSIASGKERVFLEGQEGLGYIADMLYGNPESRINSSLRPIDLFAKYYLDAGDLTVEDLTDHVPGIMAHIETTLRDPVFYQLQKRLLEFPRQYADKQGPYNKSELEFEGVEIVKATVSPLSTFFDASYIDVSNFVHFAENDTISNKTFKVRQFRLNHDPITVNLEIHSKVASKSIVRIFLGPVRSGFDTMFSPNDLRDKFVLLDRFEYDLKYGDNVLRRGSNDFTEFTRDNTSPQDLYKKVLGRKKYDSVDMTEAHLGFPERLMLPKGTEDGLPVQVFFMISPPTNEDINLFTDCRNCDAGSGRRLPDSRPFNYPFDRLINHNDFWPTSNMFPLETVVTYRQELDFCLCDN